MIDYRQVEAIIKTALTDYRESYNAMDGERPDIDFNILIQKHTVDVEKLGLPDKVRKSHEFIAKFADKDGVVTDVEVYYLRLSLTEGGSKIDKRVIFTSYRFVKDFAKKNQAFYALYRECLSHLLAGGIEYSFAMAITREKEEFKEAEV